MPSIVTWSTVERQFIVSLSGAEERYLSRTKQAPPVGFEPTTHGSEGRRSIR